MLLLLILGFLVEKRHWDRFFTKLIQFSHISVCSGFTYSKIIYRVVSIVTVCLVTVYEVRIHIVTIYAVTEYVLTIYEVPFHRLCVCILTLNTIIL